MQSKPISQHVLLVLVAAAVVLPIAVCVIVALGRLLQAMGDASAAAVVLDWIAAGLGILWVLDLVLLVLAQAINCLSDSGDTHEPD